MTWCEHRVFTSGWDTGFGLEEGVRQLQHPFGYLAERLLGRLEGLGWVFEPVEKPLSGVRCLSTHVVDKRKGFWFAHSCACLLHLFQKTLADLLQLKMKSTQR